jgi:polyferredoxin
MLTKSLLVLVVAGHLFVIGAPAVFAHGDHGGAAPPEGGLSLVSFDGYQLELLTSPRPPQVGAENQIIIKILRDGSLEPVRNGKVQIGMVPVNVASDHGPKNPSHGQHSGADGALSLLPAPEVVWAGNYTSVHELQERGPHRVRVALVELDGRRFEPAALFDFHLNVAAGPGPSPGFLLLVIAVSAVGLGAVYWAVQRSRLSLEAGAPMNLLALPWLGRWVRSKWFQPSLQIPMLMLAVALTLIGLFDVQDGGKNLATKLTWILWWPAIIFTFIIVGRLWCVMCPIGALNDWAVKVARPTRMFPRILRNLWVATLLFVLLTWADEQLGVIRSPHMTAWLIVLLAIGAVVTGLFFQRRSFCRYLCPITGLQGLYSMVSPFELRAQAREQCLKECHQDCYRGSDRGSGCPMFEFPMTLDRNTYCNLCFECVKGCPPQNIVLRAHSFGKDLWASARRSLDESYLALALVGITTIVTAQMLSAWSGWISQLARLIPLSVRTLMKPVTYLTLTETVVFLGGSLVLFPLLGYLAARAAERLAGEERQGLKRTFVALGYMFIPVGLAMHLAHNVAHLLFEGPGIVPALQRTLSGYTPIAFGEPNWGPPPLASADVVYWLQVFLVLGGFVFSVLVGYRLAAASFGRVASGGRAFAPFILLALVFTLVNLFLLNQPMGMRHGM